MQKENVNIRYLIKEHPEYSLKVKSFLSYSMIDQFRVPFKRTYIKLILICLSISTIYLFLSRSTTVSPPTHTNIMQIQQKPNRTKLNAFIITADCNSLRYNVTKDNIEKVFPKFFNILCFLTIPLNDSRIHTSGVSIWKKFSSNLLVFIELWTYKIPEYSKTNELEWSFIFEDDVNFNHPSQVSLSNYIEPLQELIYNSEVQNKDGFIYLGICGPTYPNNSQPFISKNTNKTLISQKGYGFCLHASGITAKRSRLFWTEISSYRPNPPDASLDLQLREYSIRSQNYFYTLGTNFHYPPGTGHYGIAYQDRGRFSTTVT